MSRRPAHGITLGRTSSETVEWSPRKRRRTAVEYSEEYKCVVPTIDQVLLEEIDLEVSLREKLAVTIESRITWALLLQESLAQVLSDDPNSEDFRDVATEAMETVDAHSAFLFDRETSFVSELKNEYLPPAGNIPPQPPIQSRTQRHANSFRAHRSNARLIYIRNTNVDPPVIAKMACPDCAKSDFTNIQGLLNHCRLRHKRDFGTHDECMQKCAVIVPEEDQDWIVANGIELSGVSLPSLRRLFEIAVGAHGNVTFDAVTDVEQGSAVSTKETGDDLPSTLLSRTLGHHVDTPALAHFLGRAPRRRCINVHDAGPIDIISVDHPNHSARNSWRMSYFHRNSARSVLDAEDALPEPIPESEALRMAPEPPSSLLGVAQNTRFHIITRVLIMDRSLWLPPDARSELMPDHTHRWMLSVSSPSYSIHITAVLTEMTVSCLTDPPPSSLTNPITVSKPPFVVMSSSDRPFLARLTLVWSGVQNQPLVVEHWVDLDPLKTGNTASGEEQVVDVELDRYTELRPILTDIPMPTLEKSTRQTKSLASVEGLSSDRQEQGYAAILRSLLPKVPMTMKDVRGRRVPQVPYRLVSSPVQLGYLLLGRRKAIEWARARALCAAYQEYTQSMSHDRFLPLTVGDVYCWLEDEGLFIRPDEKDITRTDGDHKTPAARSLQEDICPICGIKFRLHPSLVKKENIEDRPVCDIAQNHTTRPLALDVNSVLGGNLEALLQLPPSSAPSIPRVLSFRDQSFLGQRGHLFRYSARDIVTAASPALTVAVRLVVNALKLTSFGPSQDQGNKLSLLSSGSRVCIENALAPHALLALSLKSFISVLIRKGIDVAKGDMSRALPEGRRKIKSCMLTPSHIVRGLTSAASNNMAHTAASLCLARLAIPLSFGRSLVEPPIEFVEPGMTEIKVEDV